MDFEPDQRLAINKTIIGQTDMSGGSDLEFAKRLPYMRAKYEHDLIIFYWEDKQMQNGISQQTSLCYSLLEYCVNEARIDRSVVLFEYYAIIHPRGSGISWKHMVEQPMEISNFHRCIFDTRPR